MPYFGTLITRVFTGRGEIPVSGANVYIVEHAPTGPNLLSMQASDENGNTDSLSIETPNRGNSLSPEQITPFSLCDVWVEHKNYQLLHIRGVQIFPGITSMQDLPLIPLTETRESTITTVTITPQDL